MNRSASFSPDRSRRWDLVRDWRDEIGAPQTTVMVAGLNPSKAGEKDDDPTVRKTVGFARRWGFGRVILVNLNPIVSTDPYGLPPWNGLDRQNSLTIHSRAKECILIVAAWGNVPASICRTIAVPELVYEFRAAVAADLYCIGTTKTGQPLHPSRAPYTLRPEFWRSAE